MIATDSDKRGARRVSRALLAGTLAALVAFQAGCAANPPTHAPAGGAATSAAPLTVQGAPGESSTAVGADQSPPRNAARVDPQTDPLAYLAYVRDKTRALEQYTLLLRRQERRGVLKTLSKVERIACWFRRTPFSVRMKWLDDHTNYGETVYVEGRDQSRVRFIPRRGFLGLPPQVFITDVQSPVRWGVAKRPISDFGLERMMERTLATLAESGSEARVSYAGQRPGPDGRAVHVLQLRHSAQRYQAPLQELLVDVQSDLPVGSLLRFLDGELESSYIFEAIDASVRLADSDFVMDGERGKQAVTDLRNASTK